MKRVTFIILVILSFAGCTEQEEPVQITGGPDLTIIDVDTVINTEIFASDRYGLICSTGTTFPLDKQKLDSVIETAVETTEEIPIPSKFLNANGFYYIPPQDRKAVSTGSSPNKPTNIEKEEKLASSDVWDINLPDFLFHLLIAIIAIIILWRMSKKGKNIDRTDNTSSNESSDTEKEINALFSGAKNLITEEQDRNVKISLEKGNLNIKIDSYKGAYRE